MGFSEVSPLSAPARADVPPTSLNAMSCGILCVAPMHTAAAGSDGSACAYEWLMRFDNPGDHLHVFGMRQI